MPSKRTTITQTANCMQAAEPLWKRAPTRDSSGRPFSDFMMIIPRLRQRPQDEFLDVLERLERVLHAYHHAVVFADLNPKINILWVSIRPIPGMVLELATAINHVVPEARLVAENPEILR